MNGIIEGQQNTSRHLLRDDDIIDIKTGGIVTEEIQSSRVLAIMEPSARMNLFNQVSFFITELPAVLSTMSNDELILAYGYLYEMIALRWKVSCAILAEAYYRIKMEHPDGSWEAFTAIAQSFGVQKSRGAEKIRIWKTFWQQKGINDRVCPNENTWVFDGMATGGAYFSEALKADDPLEAINRGETAFLEAEGRGEKYSAARFGREIVARGKPERERLDKMSTTLAKAASSIRELSNEGDVSHPIIKAYSKEIEAIGGQLAITNDESACSTEIVLWKALYKTMTAASNISTHLSEVTNRDKIRWIKDDIENIILSVDFEVIQ